MDQFLMVGMFGEFTLSYGGKTITEKSFRSPQLTRILVYFIINRKRAISSQELIDMLWSQETGEGAGALQNLIYRLRKVLAEQLDIDNCIINSRGSYYWNEKIVIKTDSDEFDIICQYLAHTQSDEKKLELYDALYQIYKGSYVNKLNEERWLLTTQTYYRSAYLTKMKEYSQLLDKLEKYELLEKMASLILQLYPLDDGLEYYYIKSLAKQKKYTLALDHYRSMRDTLYEKLGLSPSDELQRLFLEIQSASKDKYLSITEIQEGLLEEGIDGSYFCEYPVFKEVYRLFSRMANRLNVECYICLVDIMLQEGIDSGSEFGGKVLRKGMIEMKSIIKSHLRTGDVASRYSQSQYLLLLQTHTLQDVKNVMKRLETKFYSKVTLPIVVKTSVLQISSGEKRYPY